MKHIYSIFATSLFIFMGLAMTSQPVRAADAIISGTVTHQADGTAVTTMLVYAENSATGDSDYDFTDATGAYSITIDDEGAGTAGEYVVYNYTSTNDELNVVFIRSIEIVELIDGEIKTGVDLSLTRRAKFNGTVYRSDGTTPIYYTYVYYTSTNGWTLGYGSDYSTYSGLYAVSPTPYPDATQSAVGQYNVTATAAGFFGAQVNNVALGNNETTTTQNFTLTAQSTVSGSVVDQDGNPVVGATVTLDDLSSTYSYQATTDSNGQYTVNVYDLYDYNGTAVGNYGLIVAADGYMTKSRSFEITADESSSIGNDFTLQESGTITGTIFKEDGTTVVADATVQADDGSGSSYSTTSAADGTFSLIGLKAGSDYTLTVTKTGYVKNIVYGITIVAGETTAGQDVQLTDTVKLSGTVIVQQGSAAIGEATISLFNRNKPRSSTADYTTTSFTDGTFIISNIDPGHYRVQVNQTGYIKLKKNDLDLTTAVSGRTFKLEQAAVIFGNITTKDGTPIHNAYVTVSAKAASDVGYGGSYTDMNGNYRINNLKAGKYTVKVSTTGYVEKVTSVRARKGESKELNLKLQSAGSISGQIRDAATGLPMSYYTVRVRKESVTTTADVNGYYTIDGLAPGKYTVYIVSTAYKTITRSGVQVSANKETKNINFELEYK